MTRISFEAFDYTINDDFIRTSRCGDFHRAIALLEKNRSLAETMTKHIITHEADAAELPLAYAMAKDPDMIKILIRHDL